MRQKWVELQPLCRELLTTLGVPVGGSHVGENHIITSDNLGSGRELVSGQ